MRESKLFPFHTGIANSSEAPLLSTLSTLHRRKWCLLLKLVALTNDASTLNIQCSLLVMYKSWRTVADHSSCTPLKHKHATTSRQSRMNHKRLADLDGSRLLLWLVFCNIKNSLEQNVQQFQRAVSILIMSFVYCGCSYLAINYLLPYRGPSVLPLEVSSES